MSFSTSLQEMSALPEVMRAAVYHSPGVIEVEERPVPIPPRDHVLVEVEHCGICGSDLHLLLEGWIDNPGLIAGHEFSGVIVRLGEGVDGWSVGDRVVGGPSPRCGTCRRCVEKKPSQCENKSGSITDVHDGAFAGYTVVSAESLFAIPNNLSTREAALCEPLAVALHGITRSNVVPGDSAMVIGVGPIGAMTIAVLRSIGVDNVIAVEPGERRRELASAVGATVVLQPEELHEFPIWEPESISEEAVDVVFECSGKKQAMEAGFSQLRRGGILVLLGPNIESPTFDLNRMILNELEVKGSFIYDFGGFEKALELLASGKIPNSLHVEPIEIPLDLISETLVGLSTGQFAGKVLVAPNLVNEPAK